MGFWMPRQDRSPEVRKNRNALQTVNSALKNIFMLCQLLPEKGSKCSFVICTHSLKRSCFDQQASNTQIIGHHVPTCKYIARTSVIDHLRHTKIVESQKEHASGRTCDSVMSSSLSIVFLAVPMLSVGTCKMGLQIGVFLICSDLF